MTEKRFKSRCYEKQKNVVIYDKGDKLFDVSYRDFEDAYYLKMKLSPVIDKLNELSEENSKLHTQNDFLKDENQHMRDLVNENRQLKQQLEDCKDVNVRCCNDYSAMRRDVWKYKEENEQLKSDNECYVKRYSELFEDYIACKKENEQLKKEIHELNQRNNQVLAYNSACEDTLLNVELVLHRLIDKCCSNNNDDTVSICEVLQEFKKEIFPSLIQPEIKPILGPVGRCVPNSFEIKKEKPEEVLKNALKGLK